jgi:hypothetical protein
VVTAAGGAPAQEAVLEHLMPALDTPHLQLSGLTEAEDSAEVWKRYAAATLMAAVALLVCAVIVVILAPMLPHAASVSHAAGLSLSPMELHARS